jgi:hypothetical protein
LPPRLATCSSIASFTVLLCAALILEDMRQYNDDFASVGMDFASVG